MLPVSPKSRILPFGAPEFTWATFEEFFCAFLASQPALLGAGGDLVKVIRARPYGRKGDKQNGIDIRAEMANDEVWVFQCKHYPRSAWTPAKTREAIESCVFEAERKFLLVTRELSEDCFQVVEERYDWELWDSRRISAEFLERVEPLKGSAILYRCFGPGWPEAFFDRRETFPLIGAEARYFKLLGKGSAFHQRTKLIGRKEELKRLHAFAKAKRSEVLLLPGRAGIGKSRLLLEFARTFNRKHRDATILFLSDAESHASDYADALAAAPKPLVLVFDDAHRLGEVRRALFPVLGKEAGRGVKLVLALRPGPTQQIRRELVEAGFASAAIEEWAPLEPLSADEALKLSETVLGQWKSPRMRQLFTRIARESPLLAVMGAELWKSGRLKEKDIRDTAEFRDKVFLAGFDRDIEPISERYSEEAVRTFGKLLALLGPVKFESSFFEAIGSFPGFSLRQDQFHDLAAAFDQAGLLLETEAGYRIVPDLLSDQLAFEACYDSRGGDKAFAVEVVRCFNPEVFPRLIQRLAEAEWQAVARHKSRETILEPVWQWFEGRFRDSPFHERRMQLKQWSDISHLQPERTLKLAELAMRLTEAPMAKPKADFFDLVSSHKPETHDDVLQGIPAILKPLANTQPEFTGRCFDLLWDLGKDLALPVVASARESEHPILMMGEIAKAEYWKRPAVTESALAWVKRKALDGSMKGNGNPPRFLLAELLKPFFRIVSEEKWISIEAFDFRVHLLQTSEPAGLREAVFALCRNLADKGDFSIALGIADMIDEAIQPIRIPYGGGNPTPSQQAQWDEERKKALVLAVHLIDGYDEPLLHFRLRKALLRRFALDEDADPRGYLKAVQNTFELIPDTFEMRLARVTLGYAHDEFHEGVESEGWEDRVKRSWTGLVGSVADELVRSHPDPRGLVNELKRFVDHVEEHGYSPSLGTLLTAVSERHPAHALEVARHLIRERVPDAGEWICNLLRESTQGDTGEYLRICREAVATGEPDLVAGAIECLAWLRRFAPEGGFPPEGWDLIFTSSELADNADSRIYRAFMQYLWINDNAPCKRDWLLIETLNDPMDDDLRTILVRRVFSLLQHGAPEPGSAVIRSVLAIAVALGNSDQDSFNYALRGIAERYPAEVFLYFWKRVRAENDSLETGYRALSMEIEGFPFDGIEDHPEVAEILNALENRVLHGPPLRSDEERLLRAATLLRETAAARTERLLKRVANAEQLDAVMDLIKNDLGHPIILMKPEFVKTALESARTIGGEELYRETFRRLSLLPGYRTSRNGEPDSEWRELLAAAERLGHRYADDPDLGPLYRSAVEFERDRIESDRREFLERRKHPMD